MLKSVEDKIIDSKYMNYISEEKKNSIEVPKSIHQSYHSTKPLTHRLSVLKREEEALRKKLREVIQT